MFNSSMNSSALLSFVPLMSGGRYMISLITTGPTRGPALAAPKVRVRCATKCSSPTLVSVGRGVSVRERISLTSTGGIAGEIGSLVPGDPSSWPPERQFDLLSQESGSACSSTTTSEKPRPSVIGYQLSLYSKSSISSPLLSIS